MNGYDEVRLDLPALLAAQAAEPVAWRPGARSGDGHGLAARLRRGCRTALFGALEGLGLYPRLVHADLVAWWFEEFRRYWTEALGNRPIQPHDFRYLLCWFRAQSGGLAVEDGVTGAEHLAAWQDPRTLVLLFTNQYKLALRPLAAWRYRRYIPRGGQVLEFGCGLAPIASSIVNHFRGWNVALTCADLPHLLFHAMRWKFRALPFVRTIPLDPEDDAPLPDDYDTIFCQAVLEHLPRPAAAMRHLHERLKPGGHLIFDYVASQGTGLDTAASARDRLAVLELVRELFEIVRGELHLDGRSVGAVVARKPRQAKRATLSSHRSK